MKITNIQKVAQETVYDITVDDAHHYILENGVVTHNSGLKYAADVICFLSKKKDRDEKEKKDVLGNLITITLAKSRLTIENKKVTVRLHYHKGLDRYYGLLDIALKYKIWAKMSKGINVGTEEEPIRVYEKDLDIHPELYYTSEVLARIDEACKKEFLYGLHDGPDVEEELDDNESED